MAKSGLMTSRPPDVIRAPSRSWCSPGFTFGALDQYLGTDHVRKSAERSHTLIRSFGPRPDGTDVELDPLPRHKRRDARFCSNSCRQQHWEAATYYTWTVDDVTKTGKEWEAEGYLVMKGDWGRGPGLLRP
jgi:hypothetical protein